MAVQLSRRLRAVADMVTDGMRLVDVGCDHGYLPAALVLEGRIPSAIAMDVREGPLSRAKEHIRQYGLEDRIETRLSDGLKGLAPGEGDTLVIAGMGGILMGRILTDCPDTRDSFRELILEPQSDVPDFRRLLRSLGWDITAESMILEEGKYYPVMKAEKCPVSMQELYEPEEYVFGRHLLRQKDPVLRSYLDREERICGRILTSLANAGGAGADRRRHEIEEEKQLIRAARKRYESI
ncbi:MAG: SAM-dependent methyltransferase [Blautia sp.]|nr:SAM-dependent methyltransferase [Blautia sp.]